jgi:hypothetical protein
VPSATCAFNPKPNRRLHNSEARPSAVAERRHTYEQRESERCVASTRQKRVRDREETTRKKIKKKKKKKKRKEIEEKTGKARY